MSSGKIVQIIGAVVDVEFSREELPKVYDALVIEVKDIVLEVQLFQLRSLHMQTQLHQHVP